NGCEALAVAAAAAALNDEPQCIQNAAPAFTSPLQRGQVLDAAGCAVATGVATDCTGFPHSGQKFLPVTSKPQDVQAAIFRDPPCIYKDDALMHFSAV